MFLLLVAGTALLAAAQGDPDQTSELRDRLRKHVSVLASDTLEGREAGSSGGRAACQYLVEQFTAMGLEPAGDDGRFTQDFGNGYRNVLALLPGSDPQRADEFLLIGAHYDHVGYARRGNAYGPVGYIHNGADDNASGTAAVLEIAAAMAAAEPPPRSVLFVLWDAEELNLDGSEHWCRRPTRPLEQLRLVINIDMVGRLSDDQVFLHGGRSADGLRTLLARANADPDLFLVFQNAHVRDSDHYPFFRKRIPYLMIDTGKHPDYHRPTDDIERLNLPGLERITQLLLRVSSDAAHRDALPPFRTQCISEANQPVDAAPGHELPLRLGVTWLPRRDTEPLTIATVAPGSPADRAGLQAGDTLLQFGPHDVAATRHVRTCVMMSPRNVAIVIARAGQEEPVSLNVELDGDGLPWGYAAAPISAEPGTLLVTAVLPDSPAEAAQLQRGERVLEARETSAGLVLTTERDGRITLRTLKASQPEFDGEAAADPRAAQSVP